MLLLAECQSGTENEELEQQLTIVRGEQRRQLGEREVSPPAGLRERARDPTISPVR